MSLDTAGERVTLGGPTEGANSHKRSGRPDEVLVFRQGVSTASDQNAVWRVVTMRDAPKEQIRCKGATDESLRYRGQGERQLGQRSSSCLLLIK